MCNPYFLKTFTSSHGIFRFQGWSTGALTAYLNGWNYEGYLNFALNIGTSSTANASAVLEVTSTTRGFLPPRMTSAQRDAISSPATGLTVYQTTNNYLSLYNGTNWQNILSPNSAGNVLIGTTTDAGYKLDVNGTARVNSELTVFKGLTSSGRVATFYGYQAPFQLEASIEVGMQSSSTGIAVFGGSNISGSLGGFLQTFGGSRAISFNSLGLVSISNPQITSNQYSALSVGASQSSIGPLIPGITGIQLSILSKTVSLTGTGTLQPKVSFNSFESSSLSAILVATTYTDAYNVYIDGPPVAGSNVTFTNRYSLYVNSGQTYFGGNTLIQGGLTVNGNLSTTGTTSLGNGTFTKAGFATGDVLLDNNSTDTPGVLFYYGNNSNYGIDSWNGSFDVLSGQLLRFTNKLNETGGAVKMAIDTSGNLAVGGFVKVNAWQAGQIVQMKLFNASDLSFNSNYTNNTNTYTSVVSGTYTPLSSSSYIFFEVYAMYDVGGAAADSFFSQITWNGAEVGVQRQVWANGSGGGTRSGTLFPLAGRVTNSSLTGYGWSVNVRRDSSDDGITVYNNSGFYVKITEIAR